MPNRKNSDKDICGSIVVARELRTSNIAAKTCHTSHESTLLHCRTCCLSTLCLRRDCDDLCISLSLVFLSLLSFSPPPRSLVVCENREEPWSWFQYLWWHQRPGEPLQTLRHGTTRPGLPANHSLAGFTSELPWKLLLVTAVFRLSVLASVCRAAVDLVNFESVISRYTTTLLENSCLMEVFFCI